MAQVEHKNKVDSKNIYKQVKSYFLSSFAVKVVWSHTTLYVGYIFFSPFRPVFVLFSSNSEFLWSLWLLISWQNIPELEIRCCFLTKWVIPLKSVAFPDFSSSCFFLCYISETQHASEYIDEHPPAETIAAPLLFYFFWRLSAESSWH